MRTGLANLSHLQAMPLALTLLLFLVFPITVIVVVSFWDYDSYQLIPDFIFDNYRYLLSSPTTLQAYLNTFKYALLTWLITLLLGFTVAITWPSTSAATRCRPCCSCCAPSRSSPPTSSA